MPTSSEGSEKSIDTSNEQLLSTQSVFPRAHPGVGISGQIDTRNAAIIDQNGCGRCVHTVLIVYASERTSERPHLYFFFSPLSLQCGSESWFDVTPSFSWLRLLNVSVEMRWINKLYPRANTSREKNEENILKKIFFSAMLSSKLASFLQYPIISCTFNVLTWYYMKNKFYRLLAFLKYISLYFYFQPL